MTNQTKNPIFWSVIIFVAGMAIGAWGINKGDCNSSPDCYVGSGFLKWAGGLLTAAGVIGMFVFGNRKRRQ